MKKRSQEILKRARAFIDDEIVGDRSISREDCKELLEEVAECAEGWLETFREEDKLRTD